MGKIGDFFRKKVIQEEKKLGKKYHGEYTREELRSKAGESVLRKTILTGGIVVTSAILGIGALSGRDTKGGIEDPIIDIETETETNNIKGEMSTLVNFPEDMTAGYKEEYDSEIDSISTPEDAINFVKEMYVAEYNKANGTNYTVDDIRIRKTPQSYVYNVDGVYITHGETPDSVQSRLDSENKNYETERDCNLYSSYLLENGEEVHLESCLAADGIKENVILGDEYKKGEEISFNENNIISKMTYIMDYGVELSDDIRTKNTESNIILRKNSLKNVVNEYVEEYNNKEVEKEEEVIGG